jgi:hypothetical protein
LREKAFAGVKPGPKRVQKDPTCPPVIETVPRYQQLVAPGIQDDLPEIALGEINRPAMDEQTQVRRIGMAEEAVHRVHRTAVPFQSA